MRPKTAHALRGPPCSLGDVIKYGYFHQVRLLISSGINLECRDKLRRTPLILSAFLKPEAWGVGIARTLIENGANVAKRDSYGRNVLHYACIYERQNLVRVLLQAIDFDLNQTDKMGNTALHYAAMSGNVPITQLVAQSYKKYRIRATKFNNHGRTACEEAMRTGNSACAHAIQLEITGRRPGSAMKDVRFAGEVILGANSNNHSGYRTHSSLVKKRTSRPMSAAFLTRRDSHSSINSADEGRSSFSYRSRSSISLPATGFSVRKSQNPLYAGGYKKDDEIIHCAPEGDFRNKPDYVFKLVHLPFDPDDLDIMSLLDSTHRSAWGDTCSSIQTNHCVANDWRQELKQLFKVYENQCSSSWRASRMLDKAAVTHAQQPSSPAPEEEEKGRRGRRHSIVSKGSHGHGKDVPELKRRTSTARLRRTPSASAKGGSGGAMDGSLDTSSESINSLASSKRRGADREHGGGRSDNVAPKQKTKSQTETTTEEDVIKLMGNSAKSDEGGLAGSLSSQMRYSKNNIIGSQIQDNTASATAAAQMKSNASTARSNCDKTAGQQPEMKKSSSLGGNAKDTKETHSLSKSEAANKNGSSNSSSSKIPQVKETLVVDERRRSSAGFPQQVDANKLWVQNPYAEDYDEEDEDDSDD